MPIASPTPAPQQQGSQPAPTQPAVPRLGIGTRDQLQATPELSDPIQQPQQFPRPTFGFGNPNQLRTSDQIANQLLPTPPQPGMVNAPQTTRAQQAIVRRNAYPRAESVIRSLAHFQRAGWPNDWQKRMALTGDPKGRLPNELTSQVQPAVQAAQMNNAQRPTMGFGGGNGYTLTGQPQPVPQPAPEQPIRMFHQGAM